MERSELSRRLAPLGRLSTPQAGVRLLAEADPKRFMEKFAEAISSDAEVFLCDPHWSEVEKAQVGVLLAKSTGAGARGYLMIPTGGTGGRIKFLRHDAASMAAAVQGFTRHFGFSEVNSVGVLPLHHVSGLMAWMRCVMTGGEYRAGDWKAIEAGIRPELPVRPSGWTLSLVPTQLERLMRDPLAILWLKTFRVVFLGGGPSWPALLDRAQAAGIPLSLGYGMTETAAMITALRPEEFLGGARGAGSVLPHGTVRIGGEGEIIVGGESLFRGIYPDWRKGAEFVTQDRGQLNAGQLLVIGRRDRVIISGGEKIDPAEIEETLRGSGQLPEVAVVGVPDAEWGQRIVAAYPAAAKPDLAVVAASLSLLSPIKRPKRLVALGTWPANAQGKVNQPELLRLVQTALLDPAQPH